MVNVVEGESPLQLVLRRPLRDDGEELHKVPERYAASPVPGVEKGGSSKVSKDTHFERELILRY